MQIGAAHRKLSRNHKERFLAPDTVLPRGAHFWYKGDNGLWWFEKQISASTTEDGISLAQILDDPGPFKLPLFPARYMTSAGAVRRSWCLQVHVASAFSRGGST